MPYLKSPLTRLFCFAIMMTSILAYAQDVVVPVGTNEAFLLSLAAAIGLKEATTLGIVQAVVQVLMKFIVSPWAESLLAKSGAAKLYIYLGLNILGGVIAGMVSENLTIMQALLSSGVLASIMLLVNQIMKQTTKVDDKGVNAIEVPFKRM